MAETRIPAGVYSILLRKEGGFHGRYTKKYGEPRGHGCTLPGHAKSIRHSQP